jgi:hypothetical protein
MKEWSKWLSCTKRDIYIQSALFIRQIHLVILELQLDKFTSGSTTTESCTTTTHAVLRSRSRLLKFAHGFSCVAKAMKLAGWRVCAR